MKPILKKIISYLGVVALCIGILAGWDQITAKYAKASEVKKNEEQIYQLTSSIKTLVDGLNVIVKSQAKNQLRIKLDRVDDRIYELEKKYYGSKVMSEEVKAFYKRLLNDKADIQRRLDKD